MHNEVVTTMSINTSKIAGPAARGPSRATTRGTPMKPVFGNAATSAPKAASFHPMRPRRVTVTTKPTVVRAHTK